MAHDSISHFICPPVCPPKSLGGLVGAISCPHAPTNGVIAFTGLVTLGAFFLEEGTVPLRRVISRPV